MDRAAQRVLEEVPDVVLGFGESDEYRYVVGFRKDNA
jgi:tRNA(His) 5'-end guanylyltransferase